MAWREVGKITQLPESGVLAVEVDGTPVALYRVDGEVYATHGVCTHALAFLADGWLEDGQIECPLHQGRFDVRTGKALCAPVTKDVPTYAIKVEGDAIFIDLSRRSAESAETSKERPEPRSAQSCVVIVGAGQAANAALRSLRQSGHTGPIHLVGDEPHLPYERPPLSKDLLLGKADPSSCRRLDEAAAREFEVTLHLGRRARSVDPAARTVTLNDGATLRWDALLFATGGRARRLDIPGVALPGVLSLRTIEDALAIRDRLAQARRMVVIGGGFIGLELASVAVAMGRSCTLIEREPELMARLLPAPLGATFRALAERHGVVVRCGESVTAIRENAGALRVETPQIAIDADLVLVGIGMEPNTELASLAGCAVEGGIIVDRDGRTSVPGIWAAGDCTLHHETVGGRRLRLESWRNAEDQGAAAGRSIAGASSDDAPKRPWFWTDQFGLNVQILGVPGPTDKVVLSGRPAQPGAVYRTLDAATGRLTSVIAFSDPAAIRAAHQDLARPEPFDIAGAQATELSSESVTRQHAADEEETDMSDASSARSFARYVWPEQGLTRVPDWVYTDDAIYQREVERIFHGRTWNYVALEAEIPNHGDYIRSNVGPTAVVVARAEDGSINVFENRCSHRAAEFCRHLSGNATEFVCPYHQWTYDLKGNLTGVPFRRGVAGKGGMPSDFRTSDAGLRRLNVTTHRGVVFASYCPDMEPFTEYLGPEVLREFEATFDGRKLQVLGHYRHTLPGNWKLYHENLKDPYHATLLHTFLVTFGLLVAGNRSLMLTDATGRHGAMASAKSDGSQVAADAKKEMRAYREGMSLAEPRFMDFVDEFDSPWSVTMLTIWPNLIVQREMNTLGIRQIVPTGPHEFIMKWTMFGFEGDDEEMTRHRLRQGNLMGPAGFLGLEDNEAIKFVQDGMQHASAGAHIVSLDPATEAGTADTLISEAAIRAMYKHWRQEMGL